MGRRRLRDVLTLSHEMLWARVGYRAGSRGMSYFLTVSCPVAGGGEKLLHFGSHQALNEFVRASMAVQGHPAPPDWDEEGWGEPVRTAAVAKPPSPPGWDDAVWGVPEEARCGLRGRPSSCGSTAGGVQAPDGNAVPAGCARLLIIFTVHNACLVN